MQNKKTLFFVFIAEVHPIFVEDKVKTERNAKQNNTFLCFHSRGASYLYC